MIRRHAGAVLDCSALAPRNIGAMAVKKRLGEMLVDAGIIDETQLHAALGHQRQWGGRLGGSASSS